MSASPSPGSTTPRRASSRRCALAYRLQDAALAYVRNLHAFDNLRAADVDASSTPYDDDGRRLIASHSLKAGLVWARGELGLASYRGGDDLARLFASLGGQVPSRGRGRGDYPMFVGAGVWHT
ncbi:uncharacterized protein PG998_015004 [Apiospora kogelbergensis]|uniref:uncharacterized protein n=1 Tax=Apiospora kogelbergensis TaxID=1337665 RepID=UPI00312D999E